MVVAAAMTTDLGAGGGAGGDFFTLESILPTFKGLGTSGLRRRGGEAERQGKGW